MYYVYILKSLKDHELYTGYTEDLKRRFKEHQDGLSDSTKYRRPFKLAYYEAYVSKKDAVAREKNLKLRAKALAQLKRRISSSLEEA